MTDPRTFHCLNTNSDLKDYIYARMGNRALRDRRSLHAFTCNSPKRFIANEDLAKIHKEFGLRVVVNSSHAESDSENLDSTITRAVLINDDLTVLLELRFVENTSLITFDVELGGKIRQFLNDLFPAKKSTEREIYGIVQDGDNVAIQSLGVQEASFERGNYTSEVLKRYDRLVEEFSPDRPRARLAILSGPPGCGKTYLLRAYPFLVRDTKVVIISPSQIQFLTSPAGLGILNRKLGGNITFVIEDADSCLVPRQADNMNSISNLLNLGDGLFGSVLNIRIIATTNAKKVEIDPALLRPGRLCQHIEVPLLSEEHAGKVFEREAKKPLPMPYQKPVSLAQVYEDAYQSDL